jgi:hypothetical protein
MIFHDVIQNSEEWFNLRLGKPTTSKFGVFMANYGKSFGEPAIKYAFRLAKEQITGQREEEDYYTNKHMENGHTWEPVAKSSYEEKTFYVVENGGFCQHEKYNVGGSPDGLIGSFGGGIEIKSVIDYTQRKTIKRNSFDPSYKWQLLGNMWLCDLDWIDFISYGYTYTENKKLFIHRLKREDYLKEIEMITPRLEDFLKLIDDEKKYL